MNHDFAFSEKKLASLLDFANEIVDVLAGSVPYFMVFVVKNQQGKTEYKIFSHQPSEIGLILNNDKFKKIHQLFGIRPIGLQSEKKNWKIPAPLKKELTQMVYDMNYYCIQNKIPCFMEFLLSNKHTGEEKATSDYLMEIVSPFRLMLSLYDDKITKIMRYTLDPNAYPSEKIEMSEMEEDFKDIESLYNDKGIPESLEATDEDIFGEDILNTIENDSNTENVSEVPVIEDSSNTKTDNLHGFVDYITNNDFTDDLSEKSDEDKTNAEIAEPQKPKIDNKSDKTEEFLSIKEIKEIQKNNKAKRGRKPKGYYKSATIDTVNDIWQDDFPAD